MNNQIMKSYMKQEQTQVVKHYEPIQFIYTQTIGSVNQKMKQILDPYVWTYEDILIPKYLNNHNFVFYYMFHIPPIYNWLRQIPSKQTSLLKEYISQKNTQINIPQNKNLVFNSQKLKAYKFDKCVFQDSLKKYVAKWEIAKLCATLKVNIKTTRQGDNFKNNQIKCAHLIKTQQSTLNYIYNHITKAIQCNKIYCEQCQKSIQVMSQVIKYPFAPIFKHFYGHSLTFKMMNKSQNITYNVCMAFSKDFTYIKCANKVWYEIGNGTSKVISYDKIDFKKAQYVVYQNSIAISQNKKILRLSQALNIKELEDEKNKQKTYKQKQEDSQNDFEDKYIQKKVDEQKKLSSNNLLSSFQQNPQQALQQLKKQKTTIILNKKKVETKLYREYKDKIDSLFDKPKVKDQYELDYDKGKTKKIKKKVQYRKPDFFNLYKDIQIQNSYKKPYQMQNQSQQNYQKNKKMRKNSEEQFSKKQKKKFHGSVSNKFKKFPKDKFNKKKFNK